MSATIGVALAICHGMITIGAGHGAATLWMIYLFAAAALVRFEDLPAVLPTIAGMFGMLFAMVAWTLPRHELRAAFLVAACLVMTIPAAYFPLGISEIRGFSIATTIPSLLISVFVIARAARVLRAAAE